MKPDNSNIPYDTTVSNRTISEAVRTLLSDCYVDLLDNCETAFLHRLLHAPPSYALSDDEGLLLNRLLRRAAHSVWMGRR